MSFAIVGVHKETKIVEIIACAETGYIKDHFEEIMEAKLIPVFTTMETAKSIWGEKVESIKDIALDFTTP